MCPQKTNRVALSIFPLWLVFFSVVLTGCAKGPQILKYETPQESAATWPNPPEKPRFRYVGQLTGEENFISLNNDKSFGEYVGDFFRFIVGLGSAGKNPRVLQRPQSGAIDAQGRILVTDVSRRSVVVFDVVKGKFTEWRIADAADAERQFVTPLAIAIGENDTVYVTDADLRFVVQLDANGEPINHFGHDLLQRPTGIARDPLKKRLYVADTHAHDIKVFNDEGELLEIIGQWGHDVGEFNSPTHLAFAHGNLYVTDTFNTRVQVLTPEGDFARQFGNRGIFVGNLIRPKGVATDSDGNIYVIESFADYLLIYSSKGEFLLPIGGTGSGIGQFYLPAGIWSDANDKIYVADMFNGRIVVLQYLGGQGTQAIAPLSLK